MGYTYNYIAQSSGVYGSDSYGAQTYSCTEGDAACQTIQAPNTGFFNQANAPVFIGGFTIIVLVTTIIAYALLRKTKKQKS